MADTIDDILRNRGIGSEELSHYGVKGMRWGKRKGSSSSSSAPKEDLSKLSDDELKQKISRIKLEQEYTKLTSTPKGKSRVKEGGKAVAKLLLEVGKTEAKVYLSGETKKAIAKAMAKKAAEEAVKTAINK